MLPQINNRSLLECTEQDFAEILNNPDYRENQYLDYKQAFSFLMVDKSRATEKIVEFRNDVCAFANSEGGYLIYGVADEKGLPSDIVGVDIANPDKFELDLRNKLTPIMPKVPPIQFHFVRLASDKYIVVLFIDHDYYAPYLHIEEQKNYKIYKRDGNRKVTIGYTELKNMFVQSRVLEAEILEFRQHRIKNYQEQGIEQFLLYHVIPESFLNERKQLLLIEKQQNISFAQVFAQTRIDTRSIPCVDGLRYANTYGDEKAILYNSGIAEFILPLKPYIAPVGERLYFYSDDVWKYIDKVSQGYRSLMPAFFGSQRYFGCVSIIGCKDIVSEGDDLSRFETTIDRNQIICEPSVFSRIEEKDFFYQDLKKLHLEYLLSLGIRRNSTVVELIDEVTRGMD